MTFRRVLSTIVIMAFVSGLVPASARAGDQAPTPAAHARTDLRAAIQRAAATVKPTRVPQPGTQKTSGARMQSSGGGGHTMMIVSLVTAAAGIGATYYMVKQMNKTTDQITNQVNQAK